MPETSNFRVQRDLKVLLTEVCEEAARAIAKHGFAQTPASLHMSSGEKYIILGEEFGEVGRACTYDEGSTDGLKAELVQLAAMALLWYTSLQDYSEDR